MKRYPFNHIEDPVITSAYRDDKHNPHYGEDIALSHRTAILAPTEGIVVEVLNGETRSWLANTESDPFKPVGFPVFKRRLKTADYGNYVKIDHGDGVTTLYAHLDEVVVFKGQRVVEDELIGYSDSTGNSTGPHLHWEIRKNDRVVDPNEFDYKFNGKGGDKKQEFFPYEKTVTVRPEIDILYVRSGPSRTFSLSGAGSKGAGRLAGGDEVKVSGFVRGERITYGDKNSQFWWVSQKGNYFWAGGTGLTPTLDDFPNGIIARDRKATNMDEKKQLLQDLGVRAEELEKFFEEEVPAREEEHKNVAAEIKSLEDEIAAAEAAEPTAEEAVEEAVEEVAVEEAPAEEAPAEEVPAEEAPEAVETVAEVPAEEDPKKDLKALFDEKVAALRAELGL